ncbi:hypothetical protein SDRG_02988 [Saprolegnia diclina VS20]|uniref:Uncharacterized protein n=1 Tax=Saprolegnia diclina (strain VS20) TaxID=1156394 RepID=T0S9V6_SAPDV|nr:hypothetical protein SDRG_02988 [Saprolegnia diclina VS20]EQC39552.1 hypothetical protein SDRG_02988 [Saprolegnia diclina VS20]|eukprot:XP_008606824.1 hypothetical protein SDRG_02988 [Saprolegnia diclina VS20]
MRQISPMQARRRGRNCPHDLVKLAKKYSPVLVKGFSTGNIAVVDKRSWLEVCDRKHRYGANLRAYYKEWKRYEGPKPGFWEWLDDESVEVDGVPRAKLESETVLYCDKAERQKFALTFRDGMLYTVADDVPVDTGDDGWIFVLRDGVLYGSEKVTTQVPRIHHTSLSGGECVQTAGMMVVSNGTLNIIYPHSGHYRPSENEVLVLLRFLEGHGIELEDVLVDVQRIQKVSRERSNNVKVKKLDNAHFWNGRMARDFLELKDFVWHSDLFVDLERCVAHIELQRHQHLAEAEQQRLMKALALPRTSSSECVCGDDDVDMLDDCGDMDAHPLAGCTLDVVDGPLYF